MVNPYIFREYDIRGVADQDFTDAITYTLGKTFGTNFRRNNIQRVVVGRDCRLSSPRLRQALSEGLLDTGCHVIDLGIIPTPLLYFALFNLEVDGGVMITGSHNPPDNNGFKVCVGKGTIFGEEIQNLRKLFEKGDFESGKGTLESQDIRERYLKTVSAFLKMGKQKRKVIIDSGNGTAGIAAGPLFRSLGVEVSELFSEMDGTFPNHHPDPTVPANLTSLISKVKEQKADLGIGFDGDADRIGVVDEQGKIIWGDQLMILFSRAILAEIPGATFVAEVKCSQTLFDDIKKHGGKVIMWKVGHSLMKAKLKEEKAQLAGEMSGHIFFAHRYYGYDDALYAGARLLEILSRTEKKLSELLADVPITIVTPEIRTECSDEIKFLVIQKLVEKFKKNYPVIEVDGARILFDSGWGLVRASNTQPMLVLRFEATDEKNLENIKTIVEKKVAESIREVKPVRRKRIMD
ncbi:MAG: phosphomannomutase/phosphoglucomutase [Thermodesulfobacteriota bacterium]|nr:MAG: phosphomannomutase/phosphoglucomutase [Thermodesulfobacteriota bacterium]